MYAIRATYIPREDMHFDTEYYADNHIPLAQRLLAGRVRFLQMHAEFDMRVLMNGNALRSPCVFVVHVESKKDVEKFVAFRSGDDVKPLADDVKNYTNCDMEWTVAKIAG